MSLQQVLEIREKEEEIRRTASLSKLPLIFMGAAITGLIILALFSSAGSARQTNIGVMQPISFTAVIGFGLAYSHRKNARRIAILELEVLKLKRRLAESAEK